MTMTDLKGGRLTRRRFLSIAAAAGGVGLFSYRAAADMPAYRWSGIALGAEASLILQHEDRSKAQSAIATCLAEVSRLEGVFSLHRPDSAICRLNRDGKLEAAPGDLIELLSEAVHLAAMTDGAFDPTVQPLWAFYANYFDSARSEPSGPRHKDIERILAQVGWRYIAIEGRRISFARPGMAITLNGIAQGYITDKVGGILRAQGFEHVLVNMGEQLALGPKWNGEAWSLGISDPERPQESLERFALADGAVATSGGYGCSFDSAGHFQHILDPGTGKPAHTWASVTIIAERATRADGLSTALSLLPAPRWKGLLGPQERVFAIEMGAQTGFWYAA